MGRRGDGHDGGTHVPSKSLSLHTEHESPRTMKNFMHLYILILISSVYWSPL